MSNAMLAMWAMRTHLGLQVDRKMMNLGCIRLGLQRGFL